MHAVKKQSKDKHTKCNLVCSLEKQFRSCELYLGVVDAQIAFMDLIASLARCRATAISTTGLGYDSPKTTPASRRTS